MSDIDASERVLAEQLQAALAPSFILVRRLGAGGMGIVYLARDPALKRLVAVKVMSPERAADPEARARFEREAESVAAISHPNVVAVYSVGELKNGLPYLVMQYVDGPSMADRLKDEGPLDLESAKQIIGQVASALGAAHRKGIIHRDIKAANILWDDAAGRALVSDFGIAAILERDVDGESINLTQTGVVMGTPRYMSPEQLLSEPVTEKTDIYSLGLLGYELLTGEGPYSVTSPNAIVAAHLRDAPRPLSTLRPDADPELESLLAACLEKDAHGRPSAEDVARHLERGASVLLEWPPPGLEELHGRIRRPLTMLVGGSLAVAIPLLLGATIARESVLRLGWPQVLLLPTIAAFGGLSVVIAVAEASRLWQQARRAARAGYGWVTIAEVLVDETHDTGALITGEREYAALSPARRSEFRRGRLLAVGLRAGAGLWAVIGFFVTLPLATRLFNSPASLVVGTLGVPLVMLLAASGVSAREWRALRAIRARVRRHRGPIERLSHLAATWRDSFDRVMTGVGLGHGATGRVRRKAIALAGIAALVGIGTIASYGLMTVSVAGEASQAMGMPHIPALKERATRVARLRSLRPSIDPAITPLRAGYALQSIANAGRKTPLSQLETPTRYPIPPIAADMIAPEFHGDWTSGTAIREASKGLSPEQRRYLEGVAGQPGAAEFTLIAHAGSIDWIGAAVVDPFPEGMSAFELPFPRLQGFKAAAYANVARAALALADGKPKESERLLRENIGAAFAMMETPSLIENLYGVVVASTARLSLVALYEVTGRGQETRAISSESDPLPDEADRTTDLSRMNSEARDAYVQAIIRDPSQLRGLRWDLALTHVAFEPCTDLRQMLFGPDSVHGARLALARKALVHTIGEDRLMRLAEHALDTPLPSYLGGPVLGGRVLLRFVKTMDLLSGSRRMQSCAIK